MRKISTFIERGNDNTYGIYIDLDENKLSYGIIGEGTTVQEAIDDFDKSYREMKELYKEKNKYFEEVEFVFKYDVASFLKYYSDILTLTGLSKLTGVNQGQLSHYVTGLKKPRKETVEKIEKSLHKLGKELSQVDLV